LFNDVEVLTGRLNHVTYLLPQLHCYLCRLYRWQKDWVNKSARQLTPPQVKQELSLRAVNPLSF
jgi:hypothetical protein